MSQPRPQRRWGGTLRTVSLAGIGVFLALGLAGTAPTRGAAAKGPGKDDPASSLKSPPRLDLLTFTPASAEDLVQTLDAVWSAPREVGTIPNVAPDQFPRGMDALAVPVKKRTFLRAVAPHVVAANLWIEYERVYLVETLACQCDLAELSPVERACLVGLANRYRVEISEEGPLFTAEVLEQLRRRVDVVPTGLALAQAAIESGWGASRFTRQGNSLFGQWVFSADKGMAPKRRPEGANYSVARFDGLSHSVGAYLYNLNTFEAYRELRARRRAMREAGNPLDSWHLAGGLRKYSERRGAYVEEVRTVMRVNDLDDFDGVVFTPRTPEAWGSLLEQEGRGTELRETRLIAPYDDPSLEWSRGRREPEPTGSDG